MEKSVIKIPKGTKVLEIKNGEIILGKNPYPNSKEEMFGTNNPGFEEAMGILSEKDVSRYVGGILPIVAAWGKIREIEEKEDETYTKGKAGNWCVCKGNSKPVVYSSDGPKFPSFRSFDSAKAFAEIMENEIQLYLR